MERSIQLTVLVASLAFNTYINLVVDMSDVRLKIGKSEQEVIILLVTK